MPYGTFEATIIGRLAEDITLRTDAAGKPYCYFRIAVPKPNKTDKDGNTVAREPEWVSLSASGAKAKFLAQYARKGHWLYCTGTVETTSKKVEKNGVPTVYNDIVVRAQRVEIFGRCTLRDDEEPEKSVPKSAPAPATQKEPEDEGFFGDPLADMEGGPSASYTPAYTADEQKLVQEFDDFPC